MLYKYATPHDYRNLNELYGQAVVHGVGPKAPPAFWLSFEATKALLSGMQADMLTDGQAHDGFELAYCDEYGALRAHWSIAILYAAYLHPRLYMSTLDGYLTHHVNAVQTCSEAPAFPVVQLHGNPELIRLDDLHSHVREQGITFGLAPMAWLEREDTRVTLTDLSEELDGQARRCHGLAGVGYDLVRIAYAGSAPGVYAHWFLALDYAGYLSKELQSKLVQTHMSYRRATSMASAPGAIHPDLLASFSLT